MTNSVGVDVGGTKLLGVVIDHANPAEVLGEARASTPAGAPQVGEAVADLVRRLDPEGTMAVGVGMPGLVGSDDGLRYGPNLPGVTEFDMGAVLSDALRVPVVVDNDATCATVAEFSFGAGAGHRDGVLLTIGTGIGGGIVVDGEVRHGAHGFAGEAGHMVVDVTGPLCPCGRRGCWERYASGSGLGRIARDAATAGLLPESVDLAGGEPEAVRGEHVVGAARAGAPGAGRVLDEFAWWLAAGIANLIDLLDPSIVVLGGGVMEAADLLIDRVDAALPAQVMGAAHRPSVPVVAAEAGERAGAVGAALLASAL